MLHALRCGRTLCVLLAGLVSFEGKVLAQPQSALPEYGSLLEAGTKALDSGRPEAAVTAYSQALENMQAANVRAEWVFAASIALATAYLESNDLHHAEATLLLANRLEGASPSDRALAELSNNWGGLYLKLGRLEKARAKFTEALRLLGNEPAEKALIACVLTNLAATEIRLGNYSQALVHQQQGQDQARMLLPPDHPNLIKGYATLAAAQFLLNDLQQAHNSMQRAIMSARRTYGSKSSILAGLLESDAVVLRSLRLKHEARTAEKEARRIGGPRPAVNTFSAGAAGATIQVTTK